MDLEKEPKLISSQSTVTSSDETPDIQPSEPGKELIRNYCDSLGRRGKYRPSYLLVETSSIACPKKSIVIDHGGYQSMSFNSHPLLSRQVF